MSEPEVKKTTSEYEKRVERAREIKQKKADAYDRLVAAQEGFLKKNDERLEQFRKKRDASLAEKRKRTDERISANRKKTEERYVKGDPHKKKKFDEKNKRSDEKLVAQRNRKDAAIKKHRDQLNHRRKEREQKRKRYFEDKKIKNENRLKRIERDVHGVLRKKKLLIGMIVVLIIFFMFITTEKVVPGSKLKKAGVINDKPIEEELEISKEYAVLEDISENQLLWNLLMEHFDGNKTAVLGVMCNLNSESKMQASNLEDYNNQLWGIADDDYTEGVNRNTIDKNDFTQSRINDVSNGYYNNNNQWVNKDGGYGYAQYTSFEKKLELYQFAEQWFGPGGEGENYKFNIGDPTMQAHFIVHLLESPEYQKMDSLIRNAGNVVDACYYWLKMYEIPYDPYNDDYFTLAFDRAAAQDDIKAACDH